MRCGRSFVSTKLIGKRVGEPVRQRTERIERARERQGAVVRGLQRPRHVHVHVQVRVLEDEFGSRQANGLFDRVDISLEDACSLGLDSDDDRHRPLARVLTQTRERLSRRIRHFAVVAVPDVPRVEVVLGAVIFGDRRALQPLVCWLGRGTQRGSCKSVHTRPAPGRSLMACVITVSVGLADPRRDQKVIRQRRRVRDEHDVLKNPTRSGSLSSGSSNFFFVPSHTAASSTSFRQT